MAQTEYYDVVVIGAGNAALCAALAAREQGSKVLVVEKAPRHQRGGNSFFTDGAIRFAFSSLEDVRKVIPSMSDEEADKIILPPYTADQYLADMVRVTSGQTDLRLAGTLANRSYETMLWMTQQGIQFAMIYDNQSFEHDGKHHFWGNLNVKSEGRGVGLVNRLFEIADNRGIDIWYETTGCELLQGETGDITGLIVEHNSERSSVDCGAVVIASGGFEANKEKRGEELGHIWRQAVLRGTSHNTGRGLAMALEVGAQKYGQWTGCHNCSTDANAPVNGDYFDKPGDIYKKHSYPFSVMVNRDGKRFVDEGADFRNYTYAKYGREVLKQPGHIAYQIFDNQVRDLLRSEYWEKEATCIEADTLTELAEKMDIDRDVFLKTISDYNEGVQDGEFNPHAKDGKGTAGVTPPKSNWANRIEQPPFLAFPVTCGITFTFGGVKVSERAEVLNAEDEPIPGLYAAGEMVGGLFFDNYPGGSGLMSGAVFGKLAGGSAASYVSSTKQQLVG
jgi:tricarballylate dehydrogenase